MNTSRLLYSLVLSGGFGAIVACQMDTRPRAGASNRAAFGDVARGVAADAAADSATAGNRAAHADDTAPDAGVAGMAGAPGAAGTPSTATDGGSQSDLPPTLQRCTSTL